MTSTERERERERKRENEEVHKQKLKKCSQQGNKLRIQKETKGTLAGREKIATFREKEKRYIGRKRKNSHIQRKGKKLHWTFTIIVIRDTHWRINILGKLRHGFESMS